MELTFKTELKEQTLADGKDCLVKWHLEIELRSDGIKGIYTHIDEVTIDGEKWTQDIETDLGEVKISYGIYPEEVQIWDRHSGGGKYVTICFN